MTSTVFFFSIRVLPHQQNTGGFFIAVIKKTEDFKMKRDRLQLASESAKQAEVVVEAEVKNDDVSIDANGETGSPNAETEEEAKREKRRLDDFDKSVFETLN